MTWLTSRRDGIAQEEFPLAFMRREGQSRQILAKPRILGNWKTYSLDGIQESKKFPLRFTWTQ